MLNEEIIDEMARRAKAARQNAYCPYSKNAIGACVLTSDGAYFTGANVENASYGLSICAERVAIFRAVAAGSDELDALCVVGGGDAPCVPCGACCQVMAEFGIRDVIMANEAGEIEIADLFDIAPFAVRKKTDE